MPPLFGWRSYPRTAANLLIFAFAALGCEWLVHQIQYLIEYGNRFNAVMANSPHRLYMVPAGLMLVVVIGGGANFLIAALSQAARRRKTLLLRLPHRLHRYVPVRTLSLPWSAVFLTAYALLVLQTALYFAQENVEGATVTGAWPGFWVFLTPGRLTVIPLHLVAAASCSIILWTAFVLLRRSRHAVQIVRALVAMFDRRAGAPVRLFPLAPRIPSLRPRAGELGLRSPPLWCA